MARLLNEDVLSGLGVVESFWAVESHLKKKEQMKVKIS